MVEPMRCLTALTKIAIIKFSLRAVMDNPYQTKPLSEHEKIPSPFGVPYWLTLFISGMGFVLLVPFLPAIGLIGIGGFVFALFRTLMYAKLISNGELLSATEKLSGPWFPYLLANYACGLLATVAASVGFIAVCVPSGIALFSIGSPGWPDWVAIALFAGSVIAAIVVAVAAGGFVVRSTLPRKDAIHSNEVNETWVVDPRTPDVPAKLPTETDE